MSARRAPPRPLRLAALALLLSAAGCAAVREGLAPAPEGVPAGKEGWLRYTVGQLHFDAPAGWNGSGGPSHLKLERPDALARLEVSTPEAPLASAAACMAEAERRMKRGEAMQRARRHPTRLAGMKALALEGDQGGWQVWAWAACDGAVQYQVFLTARTPAAAEVVDVLRALGATARVGGDA